MKYGCSLSPVLLDIFKMSDAAHGEVYEAFWAVKKPKVGIIFEKKVNFQIIAGADL
jgi:hypothetical protein